MASKTWRGGSDLLEQGPVSTLLDTLRPHCMERPAEAAILAPGRLPLTYFELAARIEHTISMLRECGVTGQDRVAVVMQNGPELAVLCIAIASFAACAPLNPSYRAPEFERALLNIRPRYVAVSAELAPEISEIAAAQGIGVIRVTSCPEQAAGTSTVELCLQENNASARPNMGNALILQTSGTTSTPKLVGHSQASLIKSAGNIARSLGLTPSDRSLAVMPLFHVHGLLAALLASLVSGSSVVCCPAFRVSQFFGWLTEFRPTWYTAVPTMHAAIVAHAAHAQAIVRHGSLGFVRSCSAPLPARVALELEDLFGVPVIEAYGMTEACHQICSNPLPPHTRKRGSVGIPTGTEVRIINEQGIPLRTGEEGEIAVRGPWVISGYLDNPLASAQNFDNGWLRTGDIGVSDGDGFLFIRGRSKEIINRGGAKISPVEIENALLSHPAVAESVCFAIPDVHLGEDVGAAVVLRESHIRAADLRAFAATKLAAFKVPRQIAIVDELPKGATGKLQRQGMAEKLGMSVPAENQPANAGASKPRLKLHDLLVAMWSRALKVPRVGIRDNFFELGGDSAAATEVMLAIEQLTGAKLPVGALFEAPTITELAHLIEEANPAGFGQSVIPITTAGSQPPFFCVYGGPLYWALAKRFEGDRALLSVFQPADETTSPQQTLEELAAFLVRSIQAVQPQGPYFIGGWCMDGVIAYEVAQQLMAQNHHVGLLVLFDSLNPGRWSKYPAPLVPVVRMFDVLQKGWFHLTQLPRLRARDWLAYLREPLSTIQLELRRWYHFHGSRLSSRVAREAYVRDSAEFMRNQALRYRPKPYAGQVLVFRRELRPLGPGQDRSLGWDFVVRGRLDVVDVPGDHRDMFREPHVEIVWRKMSSSMERLVPEGDELIEAAEGRKTNVAMAKT